ncbi:hypothetical protein TrRE_jg9226 [Triparma retinervis]|uniref:Uncharacterized protein n=1 Tax=Triparma retinervis TaxID=2557542 RepID=A0A9W7G241_9STRA|nr:hypothetical protein TrRE_jg9226 [Triparma retinervis]
MFMSLVLSNAFVLPFESTVYSNVINGVLVPLAIPLLLFDGDLKKIARDAGPVLRAFFVGAISTVAATVLSFRFIPMADLGSDGWKVAAALASRHIGGAVNFVAVANTLGVKASTVSSAIAADNVVVALYFVFLFSTSRGPRFEGKGAGVLDKMGLSSKGGGLLSNEKRVDLESISLALSVAAGFVWAGQCLTKLLLPAGVSSLPMLSFCTVVCSTMFPTFFGSLRGVGSCLGVLFIQMFFAGSGASGNLVEVVKNAPTLFLFSFTQIAMHWVFLVVGGRVMHLGGRELYVASNANVGGPTTAAAMAKGKGWEDLVLPGLLVGILGYASGTVIGVGLGLALLKGMAGQ